MILTFVNALILLFLTAPIIVVVATAFTTTGYPVFPPQGFTLKWFERFLAMPEFTEAVRRSAMLALASTAIAAVLGTFSALALARWQGRGHTEVHSRESRSAHAALGRRRVGRLRYRIAELAHLPVLAR